MLAVLHFIPDDGEVRAILDAFADALPPGSHLVISHVTDAPDPQQRARLRELARTAPTAAAIRSPVQIARFFDRFPLVPPGLVPIDRWRPEADAPAGFVPGVGGVGRGA